jgi:hypothetical protein
MWILGRKDKKNDRDLQQQVKQHVFEALGRNPDIAVSVNEIICTDPGCPGQETIILVMAPLKKTAACKISKPLADINQDDVRDALKRLTYTP